MNFPIKVTSKNYKSIARLKREVLRLALKTTSDDESLIWSGSLFKSLGAAKEKALSPYIFKTRSRLIKQPVV